jgi:DNA-binding MarR family transcriptional regulator
VNAADHQLLSLLEAIEQDSSRTQRDLARITGLNVAKVNYLLKRLSEKGHVKLKNISRNPNKLRYLYFLTPQGALEKTRLAYRFINGVLDVYSAIEARLRSELSEWDHCHDTEMVLCGSQEIEKLVRRVVREEGGPRLLFAMDAREFAVQLACSAERGCTDFLPDSCLVFICSPEGAVLRDSLLTQGVAVERIRIISGFDL